MNIQESEDLEYKLYYSSIPFLVIGFIGNMLLIRIVHKTGEMHTPTNFLLASMAASDHHHFALVVLLLWICQIRLQICCSYWNYFTGIFYHSYSASNRKIQRYIDAIQSRFVVNSRQNQVHHLFHLVLKPCYLLPRIFSKRMEWDRGDMHRSMDLLHESSKQNICYGKSYNSLHWNSDHILLLWMLDKGTVLF